MNAQTGTNCLLLCFGGCKHILDNAGLFDSECQPEGSCRLRNILDLKAAIKLLPTFLAATLTIGPRFWNEHALKQLCRVWSRQPAKPVGAAQPRQRLPSVCATWYCVLIQGQEILNFDRHLASAFHPMHLAHRYKLIPASVSGSVQSAFFLLCCLVTYFFFSPLKL